MKKVAARFHHQGKNEISGHLKTVVIESIEKFSQNSYCKLKTVLLENFFKKNMVYQKTRTRQSK